MAMTGGAGQVFDLLQMMVRELVDAPDLVRVRPEFVQGVYVFHVGVGPADQGKVIGREGRTARALRTIVGAASVRCGVRCELNIGGGQ